MGKSAQAATTVLNGRGGVEGPGSAAGLACGSCCSVSSHAEPVGHDGMHRVVVLGVLVPRTLSPLDVTRVTSTPRHERKGSLRLVVVRTAGTTDTEEAAER
ncbi:hypothetical protein GCM10010510_62290 [Streptomyces anandii JCM 4720]|nr:hypothetical protein GCM10010510_62290 [Streptomyces anandii JCM 4720]